METAQRCANRYLLVQQDGNVVRITLDAETFKALASPTRLTVLRALDERRKTLTEISRDLNLNKATVHEHLALLSAAELVRKRDDEGRKWIYYELTWRGQKLLHPQETTTFNVLLGLGVAAAGGGMAMLARSLYTALQPRAEGLDSPPGEKADATDARIAADDTAEAPAAQDTGSSTQTSSHTQGTSTSPAGTSASGTGSPTASMGNDEIASSPLDRAPAQVDFFDDTGIVALALLGFSAIMGVLAWVLRRQLRADPFRPPQEPEEE